MSSSVPVPASHISLLDDPEDGYDKVRAAATTGAATPPPSSANWAARPTSVPFYELYAYLLAGDDDELTKTVYPSASTASASVAAARNRPPS